MYDFHQVASILDGFPGVGERSFSVTQVAVPFTVLTQHREGRKVLAEGECAMDDVPEGFADSLSLVRAVTSLTGQTVDCGRLVAVGQDLLTRYPGVIRTIASFTFPYMVERASPDFTVTLPQHYTCQYITVCTREFSHCYQTLRVPVVFQSTYPHQGSVRVALQVRDLVPFESLVVGIERAAQSGMFPSLVFAEVAQEKKKRYGKPVGQVVGIVQRFLLREYAQELISASIGCTIVASHNLCNTEYLVQVTGGSAHG